MTSRGSADLDEAALQWIVSHWTYKPAVANGVAAAAQVLASVNFNLKNLP